MTLKDDQQLDRLVMLTKSALDLWLKQPESKALQQSFREANQALLEFAQSQREPHR